MNYAKGEGVAQKGLRENNKERKCLVMVMTPLAMKEVSPHYCQIMVAKRKRVDRLIAKGSAHPKVSPSRSAAEGARRDTHQKVRLSSVLAKRSVKTDWQCRPASES